VLRSPRLLPSTPVTVTASSSLDALLTSSIAVMRTREGAPSLGEYHPTSPSPLHVRNGRSTPPPAFGSYGHELQARRGRGPPGTTDQVAEGARAPLRLAKLFPIRDDLDTIPLLQDVHGHLPRDVFHICWGQCLCHLGVRHAARDSSSHSSLPLPWGVHS
jgi:hypothetical protein